MFRICSTLAENGAEVTITGRLLPTSIPFHPENFKIKRIKCFVHKGSLFYAEYNVRLFFYLLFASFDIVCACDLDTALPARLSSAIKRKRSVYDAHEYFTEVPELRGRSFVKSIWEFIAKITIPGFDLRYTVGEELANIMSKKYGVPFHVIRNIPSQIQTELNEITPERNERILFYEGALNVGRGLEEILRTMQQLPDWEFWMAGEGDITDKLKRLSKELNVEERVKFLGWVFPKDLPVWISKARIGINLREKGSLNDYYSLPNKFFDFIHAGLPSINMNYPEYERVCTRYPCALLIETVSTKDILRAINRIETEQGLYEAMVAACEEAAMECNWANEGNKWVS